MCTRLRGEGAHIRRQWNGGVFVPLTDEEEGTATRTSADESQKRRAEQKRPDPEGPVLYDSTEAKASIRFPRTRGDGPCECGQRWDRQEVSGGFWGLGHDTFLDPSGGYGDRVFNNHLLSQKLRCYPLIYVLCVHSKKMA